MKVKKQIYLCLFLLLLPFVTGCNSDPEYYTLNSPDDQMKLTTSADSLVLERVDADKQVVTFTWNEATDRGADTKLSYYFRLYQADNKSNQSELIKIEPGAHSISWTAREINDLLTSWNVGVGNVTTVVGEVLAEVTASKKYLKPEISKVQFKVSGYDSSDIMYIMANVAGQSRAISMESTDQEGVYHWKGQLDPCEYWFTTNKDNGYPAYLKGTDGNAIVYSKDGTGEHFSTDKQAVFDIVVDLNQMTVTTTIIPIYHLYMVTAVGGQETVTALTDLEMGSNVFHWSGTLNAGTEIRFSRDKNTTWPAYIPGSDAGSLVESQSGSMLKITKTASYEITANVADMKLICLDVYTLPYGGLWGIGDALVKAGWNLSQAYTNCGFKQADLKNHPEIWSLATDFQVSGESTFKILTNPNQYASEIVSANPSSLNPCNIWLDAAVRANGIGDNKFKPGVTGRWTVKLDLHSMKITMVQ
ncbi:hypothetical protein FQ707_11420 [Bacteroidaceae bacterium HV4-6-C5C]|jgi:hypothetical protein|nr:hypothetical protein FQ707_11420 [Bacteroidaceae bacterium HV4-6-C5C]